MDEMNDKEKFSQLHGKVLRILRDSGSNVKPGDLFSVMSISRDYKRTTEMSNSSSVLVEDFGNGLECYLALPATRERSCSVLWNIYPPGDGYVAVMAFCNYIHDPNFGIEIVVVKEPNGTFVRVTGKAGDKSLVYHYSVKPGTESATCKRTLMLQCVEWCR